jgi:asparagine N-glycosylation enzyme membrane subunit Stt3
MINLDSDRVKEELELETWKKRWALLAVIPITLLAFGLRYLPAGEMERLQALDPYFLERLSQQIAYSGGLPPVDFLSYFPYSLPTYVVDQGMVWIPALLHNAGLGIFFDSYVEYAQFLTPMFGALTVFIFYFIGKELFNKITGVSAAFFLATIPGVMRRSSAGFFEKEALGGFFMVLSLYFFIRAWKYREWPSGMISGLALGLFSISWGGSQMTWLLYPLIVFTTMFLDQDIRSLIVAYTPTVIIGAGVAAGIQPGSWATSSLVLGNFALLAFLWSRYLIGEFSLMKEEYHPYYVPLTSIIGFIFVHFSALYSDFIARKYIQLRGKINAGSGSVVGQTVAENAGLTVQQLSSQLNTLYAGAVNPTLGALSSIVGTWPLAFIGVSLLGTTVILMLGRRFDLVNKDISSDYYLGAFLSTFFVWLVAFSLFFPQNPISAILPSTVVVIAGSIFYYFVVDPDTSIEITQRWYLLIPFFWAITNILGASSRSRLIFLASFPVAFMSGYTVSRAINYVREYDLSNLTDRAEGRELTIGIITAITVIMVMISASAGYASVQSISESPNSAWMESLNYLENETQPDEVVLSWWDYGYHIETIGERSAVADGGNRRFMTDQGGENLPPNIADFFTSNGSDTSFLGKHSVDYLILDQPMIGKYGAVSQIANRESPSDAVSLLSFSTQDVSSDTALNSQTGEGTTTLRNSQTGYTLNVPVNVTRVGQTQLTEISGPPQLAQGNKPRVGCMIEDDGTIHNFEGVSNNVGSLGNYCVAEDPIFTLSRGMTYQSQGSVVLVPRDLAETVFIQLMFGDGEQLEWAEKVEQGSNGYIQLWEIDREE